MESHRTSIFAVSYEGLPKFSRLVRQTKSSEDLHRFGILTRIPTWHFYLHNAVANSHRLNVSVYII